MNKPKPTYLSLPCDLQQHEIDEYARRNALECDNLRRSKVQMKADAALWKAKVDDIETEIGRLSRMVNTRSEDRMVEITVEMLYHQGIARTIRLDTGEEIDKRDLTEREIEHGLQVRMDLDREPGSHVEFDAPPATEERKPTHRLKKDPDLLVTIDRDGDFVTVTSGINSVEIREDEFNERYEPIPVWTPTHRRKDDHAATVDFEYIKDGCVYFSAGEGSTYESAPFSDGYMGEIEFEQEFEPIPAAIPDTPFHPTHTDRLDRDVVVRATWLPDIRVWDVTPLNGTSAMWDNENFHARYESLTLPPVEQIAEEQAGVQPEKRRGRK